MRQSDMQTGITYIVCPDSTCRLFWDLTVPVPCDGACPKDRDQQLLIKCGACGEAIPVRAGEWFRRIDHRCGGGAVIASNFRMDGKFQLLYEYPTKDKTP